MQVDMWGECLRQSIKRCCRCRSVFLAKRLRRHSSYQNHTGCCVSGEMANNQSVRRHLRCLPRSESIGKLEEKAASVTKVWLQEFGIAHSIVSRLWEQFQTTGTAIRGFSGGRPRGTTPADDRYIVLQARRNRRQTAGRNR
ncbi:hypothetical protein TNCV_4130221 [Trichonephila clavipes]|nr:hypothetical protein TNCV_4130221 [Trichonephila clavipes]